MHVNVLNLDQVLADNLHTLYQEFSDPIINWARRTVAAEITGPNAKARLSTLDIPYLEVVTKREFRFLNIFKPHVRSSGFDPYHAPQYHHFYVLHAEDYEQNPWVTRALEEGNDLLAYGSWDFSLQGSRVFRRFRPRPERNTVIHHLCEALHFWLPDRDDYSAITLERAFKYAEDRQKELERRAKETEGHVIDRYAVRIKVEDNKEVMFHVFELMDKQAMMREGHVMHHCVGDYEPIPGKREFFSIRLDGHSCATAEVLHYDAGYTELVQLRGPSNDTPDSHVRSAWNQFFEAMWHDRVKPKVIAVSGHIRIDGDTVRYRPNDSVSLITDGMIMGENGAMHVIRGGQTVEIRSATNHTLNIEDANFGDTAIEKIAQKLRSKGYIP